MTPDTYRTRIYTHYVQAREQALAPETLAGLAPAPMRFVTAI